MERRELESSFNMLTFEQLKSKAAVFNIILSTYQGAYYLQHFEEETPFLLDSDLEHISLFLMGYIEAAKRLTHTPIMEQKQQGYSALAMAMRVAEAEVSDLDASVRRVMAKQSEQ